MSRELLWCDSPYAAVTTWTTPLPIHVAATLPCLVHCYGATVPTQLLQVRHDLSLLNGIHQPLLIADFCQSMTPLTQGAYVLLS